MAKGTWVEIHNEARGPVQSGWQLCFHWCTYHYPVDERPENVTSDQSGYRFIWRRPNGNLVAGRAQARIPDPDQMLDLMRVAHRQGWFKASSGEFA